MRHSWEVREREREREGKRKRGERGEGKKRERERVKEKEGIEGEGKREKDYEMITKTTSYVLLIDTYLTQLLAGREIFKLAASVAVGTGKEHVSSGSGGRRALGGHLDVSLEAWRETESFTCDFFVW